ncbi:hypothetical protein CSC64_02765 [Pseudoxanthomonas koreensis]|nr:hypothetical protein CSC64_02765 [Pseudoxanthomonas koreensis]
MCLARPLAALARTFGFGTRRGIARATVAVSVLCALASLLRGQDANWDLRNYHVYNAWAVLEGRLGIDLAPAQMQSYFVPLLDVPYFLLVQHAPAPLAAVLLGLLHGLAFLPLAWIAWRALEDDVRRDWLAPLLGIAGLASAAFLSELGNTMGDASTAPLVLGALALSLPGTDDRWSARRLALAGVLLGLAVAFKLTNAMYAVALGLAVLAAPLPWRARIFAGSWLALVALAVFALLAGPWLYAVWSTFGNPLFPQFNAWFQAPLAPPLTVGDQRWLPRSFGEALLRPLTSTANPYLVSEIALLQVTWALLYVAAIIALLAWIARRLGWMQGTGVAPAAAGVRRMPGVFFVAGYAIWLAMFSIHRYLVVLELLAPLLLWLLLHWLLRPRLAGRVATVAIALAALVALAGWNSWGHAGWSQRAFRVEAPRLMPPTVLLVGNEPQAWRLPFLPEGPVYASVGSNFPESEAYVARVRAMVAAGGGEAGAIVPAAVDRRAESIERRNRWAAWLRLDTGDCRLLRWLAGRSRSVELVAAAQSPDGRCHLRPAAARLLATGDANRELLDGADVVLARYGFRLDAASCEVLDSRIGRQPHPWHWCRVVAAGD